MAPIESDVSTGEIGRRLDKFETTVTNALEGIGTKIDARPSWADVQRIESQLVERIRKLESWKDWAIKIVLGLVLVAVLGGVIITNKP